MSDIREILVAVDFSEGSKIALDHAALIARLRGANLHVLNVWQVPDLTLPSQPAANHRGDSLATLTETHAKRELDLFVAGARARGVTVQHAFTELGVPSETIVNVAARQKYDLIALGTHGRTGVAHALLGSVAERVIRRAPCPVLTVRDQRGPRATEIRRILAPVDYSAGSGRALAYAMDLAVSLRAELDVVHVWDRPAYVSEQVIVHGPGDSRRSLGELIRENAQRQMTEFLATAPWNEASRPPPAHRLLSGEPASTLIAELEKRAHDLVVLGTHGRTGVQHLLLGSITEKLVRHSPVPVLSVPAKGA